MFEIIQFVGTQRISHLFYSPSRQEKSDNPLHNFIRFMNDFSTSNIIKISFSSSANLRCIFFCKTAVKIFSSAHIQWQLNRNSSRQLDFVKLQLQQEETSPKIYQKRCHYMPQNQEQVMTVRKCGVGQILRGINPKISLGHHILWCPWKNLPWTPQIVVSLKEKFISPLNFNNG